MGLHHLAGGGEGVPGGMDRGRPARPPNRHRRRGHGEDPRRALRASGLAAPTFTPSKANADTMVVELPVDESSRVLYPSSAKAASTLQDGLAARA